ncbi:hypothetical protein H6S82_31220 [Planktothrix sp. FACHB-1355]|uniref:Uncharacterized protein n=1 Tax=Aerosakkonema funiforme FACHB-1375 TaxID=2949571 RepID=A0A926ZIG2_9CYAN|nr:MULTISPECIES: hypothetical protein [Oscillatoriales]MBD2183669.1 hypothetical protein [Aerosakkonema funiforme FACHB-1375]MBD3563277.1 hypothetical protein [Planktothrix sp. FACHB-1355]
MNNADSFFGIMAKDLMNTLLPEEIALFIEDAKQCPPDRALTLWQDQAQSDFGDFIAKIDIPLLVIAGKQSKIFPSQSNVFIAKNSIKENKLFLRIADTLLTTMKLKDSTGF